VPEALSCDVRQQILLDLADPARGGRANVALLAARTGIDPRKLSPHLGKLKDLGLIFSQREGKEIWYETAADRVRYERHQGAHFSLTVTGRSGGVAVTVAVDVPTAEPATSEASATAVTGNR
jgi:DNA-binding transcriptional ArsR family regulator